MLQAVLSSSLNGLSINTFFCIFGVLLKCSFGFFVVIYFLIFSFNFVVILSCLNMAKICDTVPLSKHSIEKSKVDRIFRTK